MIPDASSLLKTPAGPEWKIVGPRHHHGINIPLFSLHSKNSCGVGEFADLIPLIDWCQKLGLDVIQLLPLNDGGHETSPYGALSAFALNPLHLGLSALPHLEKMPAANSKLKELQKLNIENKRIDYSILFKARGQFLRDYFAATSNTITSSHDFLQFLSQNPWIEAYALFKAIKIQKQWQNWEDWPSEIKNAGPKDFRKLQHDFKDEIAFHRVIQYLCFTQLRQIKKIAEEKGVFLKGDIPILINRDSADVWHHRNLFQIDYAAGAPPDMYAKEGQKWGFPLYNWDSLERSNYDWWKLRLNVASSLYHIYRIDHIVGFFRIWGIPIDKPAKEGQFIPADKAKWIPHGEKIMRMMLANCSMLPIGEDLGTVPPEVRVCLANLGICGTKVMRWERNWETDKSFIPPKDYPMISMTTVSTHDSETVQLWWQNQPEEAKDYSKYKGWEYAPVLKWEQLRDILYDSHHSGSLFHINLLNEYLALVPDMTWPDLEDERINIPSTFTDFNWSYKFRPSVEEIVTNDRLKDVIKSVVST